MAVQRLSLAGVVALAGGSASAQTPAWTYYNLPDGPTVAQLDLPKYGYGFWPARLTHHKPPPAVYAPLPVMVVPASKHRHGPAAGPSTRLGTFWFGYRTPSPRHLPLTVSNRPADPR